MSVSLDQGLMIPDLVWYKHLFKKNEFRSLSQEEVDGIILSSMDAAEAVYNHYEDQIKLGDFRALLNLYQVKVRIEEETVSTLLGMYDVKNNALTIFKRSIENFLHNIENKGMGDLVSYQMLENLVMAHEFYHIVEMNEPGIYTYQKLMSRRFLFFRWKERLTTASEIGAYHFVKLALGLNFNPMLLEDIEIEFES